MHQGTRAAAPPLAVGLAITAASLPGRAVADEPAQLPTVGLMWSNAASLHATLGLRGDLAQPGGGYHHLALLGEAKLGLGGAGVVGGLMFFQEARHQVWGPTVPEFGVSLEAGLLWTWWLSLWPASPYAGAEATLWAFPFKVSVGAYLPVDADDGARVLVSLGIGV